MAKETREEYIFQCTWCKHIFSKKVFKSEIPMVECVRSCVTEKNKAKVLEITDQWMTTRKLRSVQREKRLAATPLEQVGVVTPQRPRK